MTNTDDAKQAATHTPEPWYVQPSDYPGGVLIKPIPGQVVAQCDQVPEMEANARRIVATVNACQGIPTDALEQGVLRKLVQALEEIYIWLTPDWQQSSLGNKARAALSAARVGMEAGAMTAASPTPFDAYEIHGMKRLRCQGQEEEPGDK